MTFRRCNQHFAAPSLQRTHGPVCLPRALVCALVASVTFPAIAHADANIESAPLAAPSQPAGSTRFTKLVLSDIGLSATNPYDDPRMWTDLYREFSLGPIGSGIAIADYDNDGRPDVFLVSKTGENRLFRNLGGFRFTDVTAAAGVAGPTGAWKQGAAFADVNNDGRLDLHVCRFNAPNLLYINQGDGTFHEEAAARGLAVTDSSGQAAFADYDRDGWLDVYLQTNVLDSEARPNGQRDYLFHNNGDGTFTNVSEAAGLFGESQGHSATWWDYNEDGWPDLYIANDFKEADQLYRNNGDGGFSNVLSWVVPHTPHSSMGADLGDVNNDGHLDLLVADMATTTRYKDQRGMAKLRVGLPESDSKPHAAPQYMRNALYLNTGTSHMLEAAFLAGLDATDWTWAVRLEDLDNDGDLDAHFTTGMVREFHGADLVNRMIKIESVVERTKPMKESAPLTEDNLVYRNDGDLRFQSVGREWGLADHGISFASALGDLDGDGDLDLIVSNYDAPPTVYRNDSTEGNRVVFDLRGTSSNRFGAGAEVRIETEAGQQVRTLVLARGYLSSSEPMLHFGLGTADRVTHAKIRWPSGLIQEFTDLAANHRYVVREPNAPRSRLSIPPERDVPPAGQFEEVTHVRGLGLVTKEASYNELGRQPLLALRLNRQGPSAAAADLDGDDEDDLCIGGATGESGRFLFNLGDGHYLPFGSSAFTEATQTADAGLLFFDADGDGDNDLLATKGGNAKPAGHAGYAVRLFLNDGSGRFSAAPNGLPGLALSASSAASADFDRDGKLDVFIGARLVPGAYPTAPESVLLQNQGGTFVDATDALAPALKTAGMVTSALWSDVDDDGWVDLLVTLDWGTVRCFQNQQGQRFTDRSADWGFSDAGAGWWRSISGADFNEDGRLDYVVGNAGLNTQYQASPQHPAVLVSAKMEGSPRPLLIEAQYEGDTLYPVRSLTTLGSFVRGLTKRFPTHEAYARASLDEVLPRETLTDVLRLEATELSSGVFLSQPDGRYVFRPLPRIVQTSPVNGTASGDVDGDGRADIVLVQNDHAPIPEVSRFDGGLGWVLRGDGKGGFSPAPHAESAFIVPGDAKALVRTDFDNDGWADFFITRNNGKTLAFRNKGGTGHTGHGAFAVELRSEKGNRTGIGARITVTLADGRTQVAEVHAGSGYLSQSTASQFFGYPKDNPPTRLSVRWPNGRTSTHPWTPARAKLVLTPPAP